MGRRSMNLSFIAYLPSLDADFYISSDGTPVLRFKSTHPDKNTVRLPEFWEIDELCTKQSLQRDGQASLITDILVRDGVCTYRTGYEMREKIRKNLAEGIFRVIDG